MYAQLSYYTNCSITLLRVDTVPFRRAPTNEKIVGALYLLVQSLADYGHYWFANLGRIPTKLGTASYLV